MCRLKRRARQSVPVVFRRGGGCDFRALLVLPRGLASAVGASGGTGASGGAVALVFACCASLTWYGLEDAAV